MPTNQKHRPISFFLDDLSSGDAPVWVPLTIRPEDLQHTTASRATLHQTLDSSTVGWVDSFGPALPTINISGHTGWRSSLGRSEDGSQAFETLRDTVISRFHTLRQDAINSGRSPTGIKLLFSDELDGFASEVFPMSFQLRRSKTRPLLFAYNISMLVVTTQVDAPLAKIIENDAEAQAKDSLKNTIEEIQVSAPVMRDTLEPNVATLAHDFMLLTADVLAKVQTATDAVNWQVDEAVAPLLAVAADLSQAGRNIFQTLASAQGIGTHARAKIMQVFGAYHNALCLLRNAFTLSRFSPNYSDWYGASGCSSTSGGLPISPLLGLNPFSLLLSAVAPAISITAISQASIVSAATSDPVLRPPAVSTIVAQLGEIVGGTVVNP